MTIERLKQIEAIRMTEDQLIEASMFARALHSEYAANDVEIPEFVQDALETLRREIEGRERDKTLARLRKLTAEQTGDLSAAERRQLRQVEIDRLNKKLGRTETVAQTAQRASQPVSEQMISDGLLAKTE